MRIELLRFQTAEGREPFTEWLLNCRDKRLQAKVRIRLRRLECGLFGDCEPVGEGVLELREHYGAGARIYFGRYKNVFVVLLCAGTKRSQHKDIESAKRYWREFTQAQK
jgi:putative addiction module killer protein